MAHFHMRTSRPTLNLDNFRQIKEMQCLATEVILTFDSPISALEALASWSSVEDLAIYMGHERRCAGLNEVTTRSVMSMTVTDTNLFIDTLPVLTEKLITGYELNVTQAPRFTGSHLIKRREHTHDKNYSIPLNVNYSDKSKSVIFPRLAIAPAAKQADMFEKASCLNCYTKGKATVELFVRGSMFKIEEYKIKIDGNMTANVDFEIAISTHHGQLLFYKELASLPLTPFSVPGIFDFGPKLAVDVILVAGIMSQMKFRFGWDMVLPFNIDISSSDGLLHKPTIVHSSSALVRDHNMTATDRMGMQFFAKLQPNLKFGLTVFQKQKIGFVVGLENIVGSEVTEGKCKGDKLDVRMIRQNGVTLILTTGGKDYTSWLVDSGKILLNCAICSKCPF